MDGTVKWFNDSKGFGFVECQGKDYFVHYSEIKGDGFKSLKDGQAISFEIGDSPKGKIAKNVIVK